MEVPSLKGAVAKGLRTVAWVLGGLFLLVLAVSNTDMGSAAIHDIWERLSLLRVILAFSLMTVGLGFLALRWRALMPGDVRHVEIGTLTVFLMIASLLNYALPGPVGEFAAAAMVSRRFKMPAETALAAGIHGRFVGLGVAGGAALLLLAIFPMPVPEQYFTWIALATVAIGVGVISLAVMSARPEFLRKFSAMTIGKISFLGFLDQSVARFCDALGSIGRLGLPAYGRAGLWALCGHSCVIGGILVAAHGLGAQPHIAGMAFTYAIATAGAIVLYAFPGSQVGWDGMFCSLLVATTGMVLPDALALTLVVRVQQLLVVALGALALVLYEWQSNREA